MVPAISSGQAAPSASLITAAQIARIASKALPHVVNAIVDHAADVLPRYGIVTPLRLQHFMAHILVETGYLRQIEENLSYSAQRLTQVWPRRFPTLATATPYAHRPEALAALVYGGRMGNRTAAEAWANRGQGLLNTTGHNNLAMLAGHLGTDVDHARAMLTADSTMLECAAATFVALGCLPLADRDDIAATTRAINGGSIGLADRQAALKLCRKVWTVTAVINPDALVPAPAPPLAPAHALVPPAQGTIPMAATIDAARLAEAFAKLATSPQAIDMEQRALAAATQVVVASPDGGLLAGKKTYIVAVLGAVSTLLTVGTAMLEHGGLSPAGYLAAIVALVTSGGFASIRSALKGHNGALAALLLDIGQQIVLQVAQPSQPGIAGAQPNDPAMDRAAGH